MNYCQKEGIKRIQMSEIYEGTIKDFKRMNNICSYKRVAMNNVIKRDNEKVILKLGDVVLLIVPF